MINGSYVILLCKMLTDLTLIIKKLFLGFYFYSKTILMLSSLKAKLLKLL